MESQHQRHLFATYLALLQLAEEIRTLATRGATPGGAARRLQPLPADEWAELERELQGLIDRVRGLVERHAGQLLAGHERAVSVEATRRWIVVLLGRCADLAAEFEPERIARRFGDLQQGEADELQALNEQINRELEQIQARFQETS